MLRNAYRVHPDWARTCQDSFEELPPTTDGENHDRRALVRDPQPDTCYALVPCHACNDAVRTPRGEPVKIETTVGRAHAARLGLGANCDAKCRTETEHYLDPRLGLCPRCLLTPRGVRGPRVRSCGHCWGPPLNLVSAEHVSRLGLDAACDDQCGTVRRPATGVGGVCYSCRPERGCVRTRTVFRCGHPAAEARLDRCRAHRRRHHRWVDCEGDCNVETCQPAERVVYDEGQCPICTGHLSVGINCIDIVELCRCRRHELLYKKSVTADHAAAGYFLPCKLDCNVLKGDVVLTDLVCPGCLPEDAPKTRLVTEPETKETDPSSSDIGHWTI